MQFSLIVYFHSTKKGNVKYLYRDMNMSLMHIMEVVTQPICIHFQQNNNNYLSSQPTMGDGRSVVSIASNVSVCSKLGAKEQGHLIDDLKD